MDAGKLDRRITLQRREAASDDGFRTEDGAWGELAEVAAQFLPLAASERAVAGERGAFAKARFRIRKDSAWADLNAKDGLLFGGVAYDIAGVTEPDRGWLVIEANSRDDG